jgi:hypothetical protein
MGVGDKCYLLFTDEDIEALREEVTNPRPRSSQA